MIVTRSWLEEFIDLGDISNEKLYDTFNSIGLEVDSIKQISIPKGVVVGKMISCQKHPDADKLSVCQIDTGDSIKQIVCGAANVKDAEYVAVATIGTDLGEGFVIKPAELRGVKSEGMVCSSSELGLPEINDGIMILDESIGVLEVGKELNEYPLISDTVIELELTANRGDCLSVHGVARDLGAALEKEIKSIDFKPKERSKIAIARRYNISNTTDLPLELQYRLFENDRISAALLISLRIGFAKLDREESLTDILNYAIHATGVILRAYDSGRLIDGRDTATLSVENISEKLAAVKKESITLSVVGINQSREFAADSNSSEILFEASYMDPKIIVESTAESDIETDSLYYKTSRGSEPDLSFGMHYLEYIFAQWCDGNFADSHLAVESNRDEKVIAASFEEINDIIGQDISRSDTGRILSRLGFDIHAQRDSDSFGVTVPRHRHDIDNIQDIAEEVLRITGINNIDAKPLDLVEKPRLTPSTIRFQNKKEIRSRSVARGFFEAVTYAFCDKTKLEKYGFDVVDPHLALANPIAEELNGMRSTLLINLLDSVKRNVNYGIKRIPLFEIGTVFDKSRQESEKIAFVWSGNAEPEAVANQGKPRTIDFATFTSNLSAIIGIFELQSCDPVNRLMHPYQSAKITKDGNTVGYISKLHPEVADEYGIYDTMIAEMDLDLIMPKHISAKPISNYQGVYKDLSIVVSKDTLYSEISAAINKIDDPVLKKFYPIDIYSDSSLGDKQSLTVRFYIQSMEKTMSDDMIDALMQKVLDVLKEECGASLR